MVASVIESDNENATLRESVELTVFVTEPEITSRGRVRKSKVSVSPDYTALSPDDARRLARALESAADQAERADTILTPLLERYIEARQELLA